MSSREPRWNKQAVTVADELPRLPCRRERQPAARLRVPLRDEDAVFIEKLYKDFVAGIQRCVSAPFQLHLKHVAGHNRFRAQGIAFERNVVAKTLRDLDRFA